MNQRMRRIAAMFCLAGLALGIGPGLTAAEPEHPQFQEVLQLIRDHLPDVTEPELNDALVEGLIARFQPRVELVSSNTAAPDAKPLITRTEVHEETIGYLRVAEVGPGLPEELAAHWNALRGTNRLDALVLDLRFAGGQDYPAAARAADLFVRGEKPLLTWADTVVRSTGKAESFLPLAVLVNGETGGAAEAMAAALRESGTALIIGSPTSGQAYVYREFPLAGRTLRVAATPVETGKGQSLKGGVKPDIETRMPIAQERVVYADPFVTLPADAVRSSRPRMTEAELVRRRREGDISPPLTIRAPAPGQGAAAELTELRDPVLLQALDILKGITIVRPSAAAE
jgi:hypothetical protein